MNGGPMADFNGYRLRAIAEPKRAALLDRYQAQAEQPDISDNEREALALAGLEVKRARAAVGICSKRHLSRALTIAGRAGRAREV